MPIDMQKLMQNKEVILNSIKNRGPSLPVQIARDASLSMLFASAYLSELFNEKKVKMSSMKVGSSSLYYIDGQEPQLENFIQYLNGKEKEALTLLKESKILNDERMEPAIRVALRSIRDFAIPIRIRQGDEGKIFWKYFLTPDEEFQNIAQNLLAPKEKKKSKQEELPEQKKQEVKDIKQEKIKEKQEEKMNKEEEKIEELKKKIEQISKELNTPRVTEAEKPKKVKPIKQIEESKFIKNVKDYLLSKDIELLETLSMSKKDIVGKIRIDTPLGKQEFLLVAKEKKKVTEEDITLALHKAQAEKMPSLFLAPGDIDKKASEHAKAWRNLVKFEKVKF